MFYAHNGILLRLNGRKFWHVLQHGWTLSEISQSPKKKKKQTTILYDFTYLQGVPRIDKLIETESNNGGCQGLGGWEMGNCLMGSFNLPRWKSSGDWTRNNVNALNTTGLYTGL